MINQGYANPPAKLKLYEGQEVKLVLQGYDKNRNPVPFKGRITKFDVSVESNMPEGQSLRHFVEVFYEYEHGASSTLFHDLVVTSITIKALVACVVNIPEIEWEPMPPPATPDWLLNGQIPT